MAAYTASPPPTIVAARHQPSDSLVSVPLSDTARLSIQCPPPRPLQGDDMPMPTTEDEEEEEYMASLLARLELENNALAHDPKAGIAHSASPMSPRERYESMVSDSRSLLSVHIPKEALGMSLGDFWALVTRDYAEALHAMPTMTPIMIHKGIPDFLRPVVWVGVAGARDEHLYAEWERLVQRLENEPPSTENIIDKDVGRCFPTHDLFANPDGEGQRMLGQVLKAYNLYDAEIGYCQGMGFIVGILLMRLDARDAFCVFVRLMQNHGLRSSFSRSLSGLHSRIYQLQQLLTPLAPDLLAHFKNLGVEFAYLSQWFMTIFATTAPLDSIFRIYDIIIAEGANETIMRIALALLLKNEQKLLAMTEFEDVLQLLLGRDIWDPYENNTDQLIEEIATLFRQLVTTEALEKLHKEFLRKSEGGGGDKAVRALGFGGSTFRLFDNWWSPSKTASLAPGLFLRRTTSKQSLNTINSLSNGSGADSLASTESYISMSTAPTEVDTNSGRDSATPTKAHRSMRQEDRNLHEQVEGLLMALSEVQREAAQTALDLQKEQERKTKAREIVADLVKVFQQKRAVDAYRHQRRTTLPSRLSVSHTPDELKELRRRSKLVKSVSQHVISGTSSSGLDVDAGLQMSLLRLCALFEAEQNLSQDNLDRRPSEVESPAEEVPVPLTSDYTLKLESELARLRKRMVRDRTKRHSRHISDLKDTRSTSDPIRTRRDLYLGRAETAPCYLSSSPNSTSATNLSIDVPRTRPRHSAASSSAATSPDTARTARSHSIAPPRMIKTQDGRETAAAPQKFQKRTSSLITRAVLATPEHSPPSDETLLVELVAAKTREATAIQERDEMRCALDRARKAHESKEKDLRAHIEQLQAVMQAQMEAHAAEIERVKSAFSPSPSGSAAWVGGHHKRPSADGRQRAASYNVLSSSSQGFELGGDGDGEDSNGTQTPELVVTDSSSSSNSGAGGGAKGGWSWFGKRTVSTGGLT